MLRMSKLPLEQSASEFVKIALERGAPDNVTVIVARVVRAESTGEETITDAAEREMFDETVKEASSFRATQ